MEISNQFHNKLMQYKEPVLQYYELHFGISHTYLTKVFPESFIFDANVLCGTTDYGILGL